MASIIPGLRRAAPGISRDFFICHQCIKTIRPTRLQLLIKANLSRTIRFNSSTATLENGGMKKGSPLGELSQKLLHEERKRVNKEKEGFFPKTTSNAAAYWLLGSAASVFGIVVFGGLTRLTESGYALFSISADLANNTKPEYYRMETSHWLLTTPLCRRLGLRIYQIPRLPRIHPPKSTHDACRVQENLLYGMGPPTLGSVRRSLVRSPGHILRCSQKSSREYGASVTWDQLFDWGPGGAGLVYGEEWVKR